MRFEADNLPTRTTERLLHLFSVFMSEECAADFRPALCASSMRNGVKQN